MTIPGHNLISTRNGWKSILLGTSTTSTKTGFGWKGWPQRRLDSSLQRFTGAIWTNHDQGKPSCSRPWDENSKDSLTQLFHVFPHFPSSIRQEFPLLVYLDPRDCIDARIFKVSRFLRFIFIVLCSTIQNGCSCWFFWVIHLKWDSFAFLCLDWSTFHKTLKKKYWSSTLYGPPPPHRPCYSFWVIFHLKHVKCRGKWCDVWHLQSNQVKRSRR